MSSLNCWYVLITMFIENDGLLLAPSIDHCGHQRCQKQRQTKRTLGSPTTNSYTGSCPLLTGISPRKCQSLLLYMPKCWWQSYRTKYDYEHCNSKAIQMHKLQIRIHFAICSKRTDWFRLCQSIQSNPLITWNREEALDVTSYVFRVYSLLTN